MRSEFIDVPKGKCPLDVLAEMGEKVYGQGILLSGKSVERLKETADRYEKLDDTVFFFSYNATQEFPQTTIIVVGEQYKQPISLHYRVLYIHADDISFRYQLDGRTIDYFIE